MRDVITILDGVIELLTPPARWAKGSLALDAHGADLDEHDPRATCFCMLGAKNRVLGHIPRGDLLDRDVRARLALASHELFPSRCRPGRTSDTVSDFNDDPLTTHDDVLQVLRLARAI